MKKFKNLVIGGIQQKVFNLVLVTILLLIAAYTAVIVYQSSSLKKLTAETNLRQKEAIAEISETTMDAVGADSLTSKAEMAAMLADDLFVRLSSPRYRSWRTTQRICSKHPSSIRRAPLLCRTHPWRGRSACSLWARRTECLRIRQSWKSSACWPICPT